DEKRSSPATRSAVLDALGSGYATTTLEGSGRDVLCAVWSPDGSRIAMAGADGEVALWNARSGRLERSFAGHAHWVTAAAFHPDGERLLTASEDRTVRVWPLAGDTPPTIWQHDGAVGLLRLDRDGERALTATYAGARGPIAAQGWDVAPGARVGRPVVHPARRI